LLGHQTRYTGARQIVQKPELRINRRGPIVFQDPARVYAVGVEFKVEHAVAFFPAFVDCPVLPYLVLTLVEATHLTYDNGLARRLLREAKV
jgi:hypothetical protein